MESSWDVIVIGAGAAGLMAAIHAAERGRRTLLLEKNRKAGVKILMSGGTRCNITQATDNRGIVAAYGPPGKFLHSALAAFSVQDTIDFFAGEGVATKVEETGKIFPVSNKAADVLAALLRRLERSGASLALGEGVSGILPSPLRGRGVGDTDLPSPLRERGVGDTDLPSPLRGRGVGGEGEFVVATSLRALNASKVILTTGGQSYPGSGTTGDGYRFAAQLGHRIVPPRPALVPLTSGAAWVAGLSGITLPDVNVRVLEQDAVLAQRRGSLLFAHFGLSGPVILDVSRVVSGHPRPGALLLELDLLPGSSENEVSEWLRTESLTSGKKQLVVILAQRLPRRLGDVLLGETEMPPERKAAGLTKAERMALVGAIKALRIQLTGTLGFKKAEVTAGGVALEDVDSHTMQSKLVPGLYLAGEVLDLDGPIGGYNFQAAWSTGWLGGGSV